MRKKIKDYVIQKPWGCEYLVFESYKLAIWFLRLSPGKQTSMHCHPNKKTALILLKGGVEVSFLYNTIPKNGFSKIMIWPGVFHSTKTISNRSAIILEVETPKNKNNLVRLTDVYGREDKKYESFKFWSPKTGNELWIDSRPNYITDYSGFRFTVCNLCEKLIKKLKKKDILISLNKDCIMSKQNLPICKVGDILTKDTIKKFYNFTIMDKAIVLHITKI